MLCTRPNENVSSKKRGVPFVSRVNPITKELIGLCPIKQEVNVKREKAANPAIQKHKKWLKELEEKQQYEKEEENARAINEELRVAKIREKAGEERAKIRERNMEVILQSAQETSISKQDALKCDYLAPEPLRRENQESNDPERTKLMPLTEKNLEKIRQASAKEKKDEKLSGKAAKPKPAWAMTEKQVDEKRENEEDELLAFMEDLDYDKYIEDLEVKTLMNLLKDRIDSLDTNKEEKRKVEKAIKKREALKLKKKTVAFGEVYPDDENQENDAVSVASSRVSNANSVVSNKTQETIQSLKSQLNSEKNWDKTTVI